MEDEHKPKTIWLNPYHLGLSAVFAFLWGGDLSQSFLPSPEDERNSPVEEWTPLQVGNQWCLPSLYSLS